MVKRMALEIGLLATLFLLIYSSVYVNVCYGATVLDLKEMLGVANENSDKTEENKYEVIVENDEGSSNNSSTSGNTSSIEHLSSKMVSLEVELDQLIEQNSPTISIVSKANEVYDTYIQKEKAEKQQNQSLYSSVNSSSITDSGYSQASVKDSDFSIGSIGGSTPSIVDGPKYIVTPWGYFKNSDGSLSEKNLGIDFGASEGSNILSQWNGIITNVEKDDVTGSKKVTIYHGNGLYTQYSHVNTLDHIVAGYEVSQKECIGTCVNTEYAEPYKENHIFFQVSLDGEYINPLLIYGDNGKTLYEYWYKTHSEVNVVEDDEEYFLEESLDDILNPENYVKGNAEEVIYPDFNMNE